MRTIEIGTQRHTKVVCMDEAGAGGVCHEYQVISSETEIPFADISFQKGLIKEAGVNGCHNEDIIVIILDRLRNVQVGEHKCYENYEVIKKLEEAIGLLHAIKYSSKK